MSNYYLVGALYNNKDMSTEWIKQGIWKLGWEGEEDAETYKKYKLVFDDISIGDTLVIKSSYTRLNDLPFDNKGKYASAMAIKGVGTVIKKLDDHVIEVNWNENFQLREWYIHTYRTVMQKLDHKNEAQKQLIEFINGGEQDYGWFLNKCSNHGWIDLIDLCPNNYSSNLKRFIDLFFMSDDLEDKITIFLEEVKHYISDDKLSTSQRERLRKLYELDNFNLDETKLLITKYQNIPVIDEDIIKNFMKKQN